jgi:hypothetical protein
MGYFFDEEDESLEHHGIKGQRWGVRRFQNEDGTLTARGRNRRNENYSDQQYGRDKQVYGTLGARRINRNMNKGDMVSTARSKEAARIAKYREAGKWAGRGTSLAVSAALMLGGADKLKEVLNKATDYKLNSILSKDSEYAFLVNTGIAAIAGSMSYKIGQGGAMVAGGYSPNKFRYN